MKRRIIPTLAGLGLIAALSAPVALADDAESDASMDGEEEAMQARSDVIVCGMYAIGAGAATVLTGGLAAPTLLLMGTACSSE